VFAITLTSTVQFSEKLRLVENRLSEKSKQTGLHYLKWDFPDESQRIRWNFGQADLSTGLLSSIPKPFLFIKNGVPQLCQFW
jgi:hypothetical protein